MIHLNPETGVVVAGSFSSENLPYVRETTKAVTLAGARVIAPVFESVNDPNAAFVVFDTDDKEASPRQLERAFMGKITIAGLLLVVSHNPRRSGRIGLSAAAEMAWAAINGIPFTTTEAMRHAEPMENSMYFSNDISEEEAGALYRKAARSELGPSPLPPADPDYDTLLNLCNRLLDSLPDEP